VASDQWSVARLMRVVLAAVVLQGAAAAQTDGNDGRDNKGQNWHSVASPLCSQIKAKGAKVSGRPYTVLVAPTIDTKCCEGLAVKLNGKTERSGYFKILGLDRGHYFVRFDLEAKQVVVPISVDRVLNLKRCEPWSRITVERETDRITWDEWVVVD
jgi:hypothetical protein